MVRMIFGIVMLCTAVASDFNRPETVLAAPRRIVFSGGALSKDVVIDDAAVNMRFMGAISEGKYVSAVSLARRPRIDVALYWIDDKTPQRATFYPRMSGESAVWVFAPDGRVVPATRSVSREGLELLKKAGVPIVVRR